jgi:DeoR/GlpR family transcriptional regulator of sugar metabolism
MVMMLNIERRDFILQKLISEGSVRVSDLAEVCGVDSSTVRRDLKSLAEQNDIHLAYGGAFYKKKIKSEGVVEVDSQSNRIKNMDKKRVVAQKAAQIVKNGDSIILNNGSTAELILDYLDGLSSVNVITLSLNIANKAAVMPSVSLYLPGGKFRNFSGMFYGDICAEAIHKLSANKIFVGAMCVCLDHGVTHPMIEELSALKALIDISQEKYLVVDSSKFGKVAVSKLVDIDVFDAIISDGGIPEIYTEYCEMKGIGII